MGTYLTTSISKYYDGPRSPKMVIILPNLHDVILRKWDPAKETLEVVCCYGSCPGSHHLSTDRYHLHVLFTLFYNVDPTIEVYYVPLKV